MKGGKHSLLQGEYALKSHVREPLLKNCNSKENYSHGLK